MLYSFRIIRILNSIVDNVRSINIYNEYIIIYLTLKFFFVFFFVFFWCDKV